jgi:hypothetical protein
LMRAVAPSMVRKRKAPPAAASMCHFDMGVNPS